MRVYRKPAWVVLLEVPMRVLTGLPWVLLAAPLGAAFGYAVATRHHLSPWWVVVGAAWVLPAVLVHALLALRELGQRVELDPERGEVRFVGFVWWRPWTRPRLGALTIPLGRLEQASLHSWVRGYRVWLGPHWRPMRVIGDGAIVDIPRFVRNREELRHALDACAHANGAYGHTEEGFRRMIVVAAAVGYGAALAVVVLWIAGVF